MYLIITQQLFCVLCVATSAEVQDPPLPQLDAGWFTVTVTDFVLLPALLLQLSVYVAVDVGLTEELPLVFFAPLHEPEALHVGDGEAFELTVHDKVEEDPAVIVVALALNVRLGATVDGLGDGEGDGDGFGLVGDGLGVGVGDGEGDGDGVELEFAVGDGVTAVCCDNVASTVTVSSAVLEPALFLHMSEKVFVSCMAPVS